MNAIDTNVFVYAFDASEPVKQALAREFFQGVFASAEATIVPWQVAVELLARFRKWESAGKMTSVFGLHPARPNGLNLGIDMKESSLA